MPEASPLFDWQQYLVVAEELAPIRTDRTWRTAISRAYYAVFHKAEQHYARFHPTHASGLGNESHRTVWRWFEEHPARSYREIGVGGRRLQQARIQADYRDRFPGLESQVIYQIANARALIENLDRLTRPLSPADQPP